MTTRLLTITHNTTTRNQRTLRRHWTYNTTKIDLTCGSCAHRHFRQTLDFTPEHLLTSADSWSSNFPRHSNITANNTSDETWTKRNTPKLIAISTNNNTRETTDTTSQSPISSLQSHQAYKTRRQDRNLAPSISHVTFQYKSPRARLTLTPSSPNSNHLLSKINIEHGFEDDSILISNILKFQTDLQEQKLYEGLHHFTINSYNSAIISSRRDCIAHGLR